MDRLDRRPLADTPVGLGYEGVGLYYVVSINNVFVLFCFYSLDSFREDKLIEPRINIRVQVNCSIMNNNAHIKLLSICCCKLTYMKKFIRA